MDFVVWMVNLGHGVYLDKEGQRGSRELQGLMGHQDLQVGVVLQGSRVPPVPGDCLVRLVSEAPKVWQARKGLLDLLDLKVIQAKGAIGELPVQQDSQVHKEILGIQEVQGHEDLLVTQVRRAPLETVVHRERQEEEVCLDYRVIQELLDRGEPRAEKVRQVSQDLGDREVNMSFEGYRYYIKQYYC